MRVVAILAAYNEERFIGGCLEHLISQGVSAYLIDNSSTDRTVEIAKGYLGRGLIDIEILPRPGGVHRWNVILQRKEDLAASLEGDWFMHADPDEIRLPPRPSQQTLAEALAEVDEQGYNAVNFLEFTFIPTREEPEHDHPDFMQTMRYYYPFVRNFPYRVNAWKRQPERVDLVGAGGHRVRFPGQRLSPEMFKMKHYQLLSLQQARTKYLEKKKYDVADMRKDIWRYWLREARMQLPSASELNFFTSDDELDLSNWRMKHVITDWALPEAERTLPAQAEGATRKKSNADLRVPPRGHGREGLPPNDLALSGQLIVAGFHRSGTSLTARLLHDSGLFLGHNMLARNRSQPHGHFEDRDILALHEEILAENGLTWQVDGSSLPVVEEDHRRRMLEIIDARESEQRMWGFKDPRVCLFLGHWKSLLPEAKVVLVYRHFAECTYSLHRRAANGLLYGTGQERYHRRFWEVPDLALKMWLTHNKALIEFARAYPEDVLAVSYDMFRMGFPLIEALNRYWGLMLTETPTSEVFDAKVSAAESYGRQVLSDEKLIGETLDIWEALQRLGRRTGELTGIPVELSERPTEDVFYRPTDAYAAEMKREFTTFELLYAQERLAEAKALHKELQARLKEAGEAFSPQRRRELQEAEVDLKLIVKRMSKSRVAPLLRLKEEFRELEHRYLK